MPAQEFDLRANSVDSQQRIGNTTLKNKFVNHFDYFSIASIQYPRLINLRTDSPSDTTITIANYENNRFLDTDKVLTVNISIRSKTSKKINRTRHIFIDSFHPNITFQVPIMGECIYILYI